VLSSVRFWLPAGPAGAPAGLLRPLIALRNCALKSRLVANRKGHMTAIFHLQCMHAVHMQCSHPVLQCREVQEGTIQPTGAVINFAEAAPYIQDRSCSDPAPPAILLLSPQLLCTPLPCPNSSQLYAMMGLAERRAPSQPVTDP
jgi:hypothetical protein